MREEDLIKSKEFDILDRVGRMFVGTPEERQALIEQEGETLQRRYQDCEDSFLKLLDVTDGTLIDGERRSPEIVIGEAVERLDVYNYGGKWVASVRETNFRSRHDSERGGRPEFKIRARFIPDDETVFQRIWNSSVPVHEEHFGFATAFSQVSEIGWTKETLSYVADNYGYSVARAEETLRMLWSALTDPGRNYQLALKVLDVQQA